MDHRHTEKEVDARKRIKYRGTVRVDIDSLSFGIDSGGYEKKFNKRYQVNNVFRLEPHNHIPVSIDEAILQRCLDATGLRRKELFKRRRNGYPLLKVPTDIKLCCLRGSALIAAAKKHYQNPQDRWWVVDLYDIGRFYEIYPSIRC